MSFDKQENKFHNRVNIAMYMACKNCKNSNLPENGLMSYYLQNQEVNGNFCDLSQDTRIKLIRDMRYQCPCFHTRQDLPIERDTTYPGHTYAPHDNTDPNLQYDSSDIDHDYSAPLRCVGFEPAKTEVYFTKTNKWEVCLAKLFDRTRKVAFPSTGEVLELLHNSQIPVSSFRIGYPEVYNYGIKRGLWFYKSQVYNWTLDKNKIIRQNMNKEIMVYLYKVWFCNLPENEKMGVFLALDASNEYSLGKSLSWWMLQKFNEPVALETYPKEEELEIEFIQMSVLENALKAKELSDSECSTHEELDNEALEYENTLRKYGYNVDEEFIYDTDGKEILA